MRELKDARMTPKQPDAWNIACVVLGVFGLMYLSLHAFAVTKLAAGYERVALSSELSPAARLLDTAVLGAFCVAPLNECVQLIFGESVNKDIVLSLLVQLSTAFLYAFLVTFPDSHVLVCSEDICYLPLRSLHWLFSCQFLLWLKRMTSVQCREGSLRAPRFQQLIIANELMHVTGSIFQQPGNALVRWTMCGLSCLCFIFVMYGISEMLQPVKDMNPTLAALLRVMQYLTLGTWMAYPVVSITFQFGYLGRYQGYHMCLGVLDIVAKAVYVQLLRAFRQMSLQTEGRQLLLQRQQDCFLQAVHELRNPLHSVIACSEALLRKGTDNEMTLTDQAEMCETVHSAGEHMKNLVTDLLDVGSTSRGKVVLRKSNFEVQKIVDTALRITHFRQKNCGVSVLLTTPIIPGFWFGDPQRVAQIVINFLDNAIKFSYPHGKPVELEVGITEDKKLFFSIRDHGRGMTQAQQVGLTSTMFQQHHTSAVSGGSGVGLVLCQALADIMGGTIEVESTAGEGSKFTLAGVCERVAEPPRSTHTRRRKLGTALVIDDNHINSKLLGHHLERLGFSLVLTADCTDTALKQFDQHRELDVIFCDQHIGLARGHELAEKLRARAAPEHLHIASFSGLEPEELDKLHAWDSHLGKPASLQVLRTWLSGYVASGSDADDECDGTPSAPTRPIRRRKRRPKKTPDGGKDDKQTDASSKVKDDGEVELESKERSRVRVEHREDSLAR